MTDSSATKTGRSGIPCSLKPLTTKISLDTSLTSPKRKMPVTNFMHRPHNPSKSFVMLPHLLLTSIARIFLPRSSVTSTERQKYPRFLPCTRNLPRTSEPTNTLLQARPVSTYPHPAHQNPTSTCNIILANLDGSDLCVTFLPLMRTEEEENLRHGAAATFPSCAKLPQAFETRKLRVRRNSGEAKSRLIAKCYGMSIRANLHPVMLVRLRELPRVPIRRVRLPLQRVFARLDTMSR